MSNSPGIDPKTRILIVDDNRAIHQDFQKVLNPEGKADASLDEAEAALFGSSSADPVHGIHFQLDSAYQGKDALDLVRQGKDGGNPYAMAFMDIRMPPGWDGIETTAKVWEVDPDLQVVICTAYSDYSWDDMVRKLGKSDRMVILKKPFDHIEVLQLANSLTQKWQFLQESKAKMADLEQTVVSRTAQLIQAQKLESVGQLAAGIAHEINTPIQYIGDNIRFVGESFEELRGLLAEHQKLLAAVRSNSLTPELLAQVEAAVEKTDVAYLNKEIPAAIRQLLDGVESVASIVQAMKEFSHPGTNQKVPTDLAHAIQSTMAVARNEWKYVADVETQFAPDLPPVPCLPGELNQVLLNLIVNAAHAIGDAVKNKSGAKGKITISTRQDGRSAEIRISDTGTGIPEDIRHRVFEPFFTTKEVGRGTGQGLAIARTSIVKKHGGELTFETKVGEGTTFFVRLPLPPSAAAKPATGS